VVRYSAPMRSRQTFPPLGPSPWLVSDARNDTVLEHSLRRLPRGSGLIFRHAHLAPAQRARRFRALKALCRRHGHAIILAGTPREARRLGADGAYGPAHRLAPHGQTLRLITAHSLRELAAANRARADLILLSPAFPTRSHPGAPALGPLRFHLLAARAAAPVIALGGMNPRTARRLAPYGWAAIDGLSR